MALFLRLPASGTSKIRFLFNKLLGFIDGQLYSSLALPPWKSPMLTVPPELARRYEARLAQQNVMAGQRPHYQKWLRYYLDF